MDGSLLPVLGFVFAASVIPGPNNTLVAANAAANGLRATWPHMLGIGAGFALMIVLVGLGLAGVLAAHPMLATAMRWASMAWLVWLAWKIATAPMGRGHGRRHTMRLRERGRFQWVNPKGWLLALSIAATWVRPDAPAVPQLAVIGAAFFVIGLPSNLAWALLGVGAAHFLGRGPRMRFFDIAMALLLVASMLPIALEG